MLLRSDERSPPVRFVTPLPASDCLGALRAAATPETVSSGFGVEEGIVWRERGKNLELRLARPVRDPREPRPIAVHNWFRVSSRSAHGETILEVSEHLGLQKGWWLAGTLLGGVLGSLVAVSAGHWAAFVALMAAAHGVILVKGFLTSAGGDERDRTSMTAFLQRTVQAQPVAAPSRRDPRFY